MIKLIDILNEIKVNKPYDSLHRIINKLKKEVLGFMDYAYPDNEITKDDIYAVLKDGIIQEFYPKYPRLKEIPFKEIYYKVLKAIKEDPEDYVFVDEA